MVGSILIFLLVLSILVIVHELGHFLVAKKNGVWVEEFGLGIPPRIYGKKIGETIYSINLFPFGGFCRMHGETSEDGISEPKKAFLNKGKLARVAIVMAGVVMNFILGIVAFGIVYSFSGIPRESKNVKLVDIASGSPAQVAGLLVGDVIKSADGETINSINQFVDLVEKNKGRKITLVTEQSLPAGRQVKKIILTPRANPPSGEGPLGVVLSTTEIYYPPVWQRPFYGVYYGSKDAFFWGKTVILGFVSLISQLFMGKVPNDVSGPVGIFAVTTEATKYGLLSLINFVGILSINLAILNVIPFPALDGGRLLFIGIEGLIGRKVVPRIEATIHMVGMVILMLLILAITARDVERLIKAGSLSGFIQSVLK
ncbi:MAG: M50 family metallopeptidase [Candidatus Microgenomates bacterium]|jgi:regulator of sigma E protease